LKYDNQKIVTLAILHSYPFAITPRAMAAVFRARGRKEPRQRRTPGANAPNPLARSENYRHASTENDPGRIGLG
jgi:hypothetical protein